MIVKEVIESLHNYNIDTINCGGGKYKVVWPSGAIATLFAKDVRELLVDLIKAIRWRGQTVAQYEEGFFDINRNDTIRTIY